MARIGIVGGGPAGSTLALHLLARGVDPDDLLIFDAACFPRDKLCGGAITWRGTEAIRSLVGEPPGGVHTGGIAFRSRAGTPLTVIERGDQWIYDRGALDHALLGHVIDAGVEVRQGEKVSALEPGVDGWRIRTKHGVEHVQWVCGADGACGISRPQSGLRGGLVGRLVEAIYEPIGDAPDPSRLHFDYDPVLDGIPGYAWAFPYPAPDGTRGYWKLGVMDGRGRVPGHRLRAWTEAFAERRGFRRVSDTIRGWPERYLTRGTRAHRPGLVLVGEAYGIDPLLGEGIAPAIEHASYTAGRLRDALDRGSPRIRGFERGFLLGTTEGRNLLFQARLADLVYGRWGAFWLEALFELPRLRHLAEAGGDAYGRLARRAPSLFVSWLGHSLRRGLRPRGAT